MDSNSILTIVMLAILAFGFWRGWKQLSTGSGLLGGHLPVKAIQWVNQKSVPAVAVKIGVSVICAYIFAAFAFIAFVLALFGIMTRQK